MKGFRDLIDDQKAFELAIEIFTGKKFPPEEKYELTDQIRSHSRSECKAIGEGYRKPRYTKHFSSEMSDADPENTGTQVSPDFILQCGYISNEQYTDLLNKSEKIGRMLNNMVVNPEKFLPKY